MSHPTKYSKQQAAAIPLLVTQFNAPVIVGIPSNQWSERARSSGKPCKRVGQLTFMHVEDALAAFGPEAPKQADPAIATDPAERVRDALGLQRRAAR